MAQVSETSTVPASIYTPEGRRTLLIAIVSTAIIIPSLLTPYLEPVVTLFPIVAITGVLLVRSGRPARIPTWVVFNTFSAYIIVYAAYSFGTTFQLELLALFLLGMIVYDTLGVKGGQMQSVAGKMIQYGVPLFVMVPHNRAFSFEAFREIVSEEGLEGLHESDHGISMLGVGDGFLPGALAVAAGNLGTQFAIGPVAVSLPQVTTALGAIIALGILMWAELPRAIAALIVSVPGALLGLAVGLLLDPVALESLTVPQIPFF
ncbi:presenilin family intramembrane aspartyl protease [Halosimplex pelagicum]|uniref:Uncharacterized protein n=1 Tax=Halosimplex pelagicum TaxID=869886 RepID=A0A7D5T9Q2_9EURY|nr:presenilin family intramembrane aspartyl protease [Halosimplex pelagicum]QLH82150.1 hypothetical protein HZS54_11280 [Halosimplex pelagicum]